MTLKRYENPIIRIHIDGVNFLADAEASFRYTGKVVMCGGS